MKLAGILLAAGSSKRFGTDKLVHPLADGTPLGTPIALASARTLGAALPWVLVVVRPDAAALADMLARQGFATAVCRAAEQGMGASIACGVAATQDADGWLIALADMPFIRADTIASVAAELARGAGIAAPSLRGVRGHPVGFSRRFAAQLLSLRGDTGARTILEQHAEDLALVEYDDPGIVQDIDFPQDMSRRRLG